MRPFTIHHDSKPLLTVIEASQPQDNCLREHQCTSPSSHLTQQTIKLVTYTWDNWEGPTPASQVVKSLVALLKKPYNEMGVQWSTFGLHVTHPKLKLKYSVMPGSSIYIFEQNSRESDSHTNHLCRARWIDARDLFVCCNSAEYSAQPHMFIWHFPHEREGNTEHRVVHHTQHT